jgi:hypothetical protein
MEKLKVIPPPSAAWGFRYSYLAAFCRRPKSSASIIGATCVFGTKIYKSVDTTFAVSACCGGNKKIFKLLYFCFRVPSLLAGNSGIFCLV